MRKNHDALMKRLGRHGVKGSRVRDSEEDLVVLLLVGAFFMVLGHLWVFASFPFLSLPLQKGTACLSGLCLTCLLQQRIQNDVAVFASKSVLFPNSALEPS